MTGADFYEMRDELIWKRTPKPGRNEYRPQRTGTSPAGSNRTLISTRKLTLTQQRRRQWSVILREVNQMDNNIFK